MAFKRGTNYIYREKMIRYRDAKQFQSDLAQAWAASHPKCKECGKELQGDDVAFEPLCEACYTAETERIKTERSSAEG